MVSGHSIFVAVFSGLQIIASGQATEHSEDNGSHVRAYGQCMTALSKRSVLEHSIVLQ